MGGTLGHRHCAGLALDRLQHGFYLAGLQNIDYSIYEAARIDGASPLQQFIHLTIPC